MKTLLIDSRQLIVILLLTGILGLMDHFALLELPKGAVQFVVSPIQYGLYQSYLKASHQYDYIVNAREASQKNKALTEQLAVVLSENASLRRKLAEAQGFLAQEKSLDAQTYPMVAARPIGFDRFLTISKGTHDGISVGQPVVYKDNLIGQISGVSTNVSQVMLISDPDSKIGAFVSNEQGRAKGILSGQFGSDLLLDKVLHQESVQTGDLVYSDGAEGKFPRGLILGQVEKVADRENEIFKQASVKPVFDLSDLDIVFVIVN